MSRVFAVLAALCVAAVAFAAAEAVPATRVPHLSLTRKSVLEAAPEELEHRGHRRHKHNHVGSPTPRRHHLDHAQGSYYAHVTLAGQEYPVDVDTGSSLFAVPSVDCVACATDEECKDHSGPKCPGTTYNPAGSATNVPLACPPPASSGIQCPQQSTLTCGGITASTCECATEADTWHGSDANKAPFIQQCYSDGSGWRGQLMEDVFDAGYGLDATVFFVAKTLNIKDAESPKYFTGIIGMAYGPALSGVPTPFERLVTQTGLADVFTMCLCADSGTLTLGGGAGVPGMQYTAITQKSYYVVQMDDFLVNGTSVGVASSIYNDGQCIVDSGTTDLALPHSAYLAFYKALAATCASSELVGICGMSESEGLFGGYEFEMTAADIAAFPTVAVVLTGDLTLEIPPMSYLTTSGGYTSLAVSDMGDDVSGTILGDTLMRNFIVEFDRENLRVGFGPQSGCCDARA